MGAVGRRAFQRNAVERTLHDRISLRVRRAHAVLAHEFATDFGAVRDAPRRTVVARREDPVIAHQDRADAGARTRRARGDRSRDLHEVLFPARPHRDFLSHPRVRHPQYAPRLPGLFSARSARVVTGAIARRDRGSASEHAVARIAETRHDVAVVVEPLVDRAGNDPDRGMFRAHVLDAGRRGDDAEQRASRAPRSANTSSAAAPECPVASIGSSAKTSAPLRSSGRFA